MKIFCSWQNKKYRNFIEKEIQRMLQEGLIKKSTCPWAAPVVLIHKKMERRLCVNYWELNSVMTKDIVPRIDNHLINLERHNGYIKKYFSSQYHTLGSISSHQPSNVGIQPTQYVIIKNLKIKQNKTTKLLYSIFSKDFA